MNKPHKHAELIKQWANGAEIEVYCKSAGRWYKSRPSWDKALEYRVKPKPIRYLVVKEVSPDTNVSQQRLPHDDVENYFNLHELVQEHETDEDNQHYEVFKDFNESYKAIVCDTYPSLGVIRMSKQCAEKLCDMLNNGEIEL